MRFAWDSEKDNGNRQKHGVSFEEAATVFYDPLALVVDDQWHSGLEAREHIYGRSEDGRLLIVCYTEREGNILRIISARPVTMKERQGYEKNRTY